MTDTEVRMCDCLRTCAGVCVGVGVKKIKTIYVYTILQQNRSALHHAKSQTE